MTGVRVRTVLYARWERKKERKKEKLGLVREGEGFWGLDGWRVGGEVERWRGGGRCCCCLGVVSSWWIGGILAGEEGEGERWGGVRRVEGAGGFFLVT